MILAIGLLSPVGESAWASGGIASVGGDTYLMTHFWGAGGDSIGAYTSSPVDTVLRMAVGGLGGGGITYTVSGTTYDSVIGGFAATLDTPPNDSGPIGIVYPDSWFATEYNVIDVTGTTVYQLADPIETVVIITGGIERDTKTTSMSGAWSFSAITLPSDSNQNVIVRHINRQTGEILGHDTRNIFRIQVGGSDTIFQENFQAYAANDRIATDSSWQAKSTDGTTNNDVFGKAWQFDNTDGGSGTDGYCTWITAMLNVSVYKRVRITVSFWSDAVSAFDGDEDFYMTVDTGYGFIPFMDSSGFLGRYPQDSTFLTRVQDTLILAVSGLSQAAGERLYFDSISILALDTITIDLVSPGGTHETNATGIVLSGRTSLAAGDSIQIYINNSATDSHVLGANGLWSCTGIDFKDKAGESIGIYAFAGGSFVKAETINIVYDVTTPKLTKRGAPTSDTNTIYDGVTVSNADVYVLFSVVDTGAGLTTGGSSASCTLAWHVDRAAGYDTVAVSVADNGSGTYVIEALLPLGIFTTDTTVSFWWICKDDVTNGTASMASSLSGPAYTANSPGTITIDALSVRDIIISEINYGGVSTSDDMEFVELFNRTASTISLNGLKLRDGHGDPDGGTGSGFEITFGASDEIAAYSYFVVYQRGDGDVGSIEAFTDTTSHTVKFSSDWDADDDLANDGDSVALYSGSTIIDSAPFLTGWPAGAYTGATCTNQVSMERKMSGANFLTVTAGDLSTSWDSHTRYHGHGGRPNATPGHVNSVNIPQVTAISPQAVVASGGRGKWQLTVTNGRQAFTSGRIIVTVPPGWSQPNGTSDSHGYTTVSISNGSGSTTFSQDSIIVDLTSWTAQSGLVDITYGDNSVNRNGLARVASASSKTPVEFQLFYDTEGTAIAQAGDSGSIGSRGDSLTIVEYDANTLVGGTLDTSPSTNPQSFFGSEYILTITHKDSYSRPIYGAHDSVTIRPLLTSMTAASDSHVHEEASFTGFYEPTANDTRDVGGWTNSSGEFQALLHVSAIAGNDTQLNEFRVYWGHGGNFNTFSDSARLPVPVINELGWDGTSEFIEFYNPTHKAQNVYNWHVRAYNAAATRVDSAEFRNIGVIAPFSYVIFMDDANTAQDSGLNNGGTDSQFLTATALSFTDAARESFVLRNDTQVVDIMQKSTGRGYWNDAPTGNGDGTADKGVGSSLERTWPNRSGILQTSWNTTGSDSAIRYVNDAVSAYGSPGRPNASALSAYDGKFFERLDTFVKATDSATISFTLRIASGDTQPNQQIGFSKVLATTNKPKRDTGLTIISATSEVTSSYGTSVIRVSQDTGASYSTAFSGTAVITCVQPFGVPDTTYIVFDRGDSFLYSFQSSETNVFDTTPPNAMVVFAAIFDTFSGLDSSIMPQLRWKIGTGGTYSTLQNMKRFTDDTFYAQIDISSSTWAIKPHDTIYWQVTWRDKAGNYDTSVDNNVSASEFIDNTRARDTISTPTGADTRTTGSNSISIKLVDQNHDYCTVVLKYDTYSSGLWTNVSLSSGDITDIVATAAGQTQSLNWDIATDFVSGTTIASVRLRVEVYDGFDTHTDTSGFFGVDRSTSNTAPRDTIILPTTGDTYIASGETYAADIGIKFVILDPDSNFCTVVVQFSKDSGQTWSYATLTGTSVISSLYAPTFGDTKTIAWMSKIDAPDTRTTTIRIRITPGDGTDTGLPDTTLNFGIDNQRPPIVPECTAAAVVGVGDSGVYIFWAHAPLDSDVKGYYVYRGSTTDSADHTRLSSLLTDTRGYKDLSVEQGDTWYYYVTSVDTYLNEGDSSELEGAPNVDISKTISDSSNPKALRPGDSITFRITIRNNGFAPADSVMMFDYVPSNTTFYDSPTTQSVYGAWTVHYRVAGASSADVWQAPFTDTATMVRFTRSRRIDPDTSTPHDTLTIRVKIQ